MKTTQKVAEKPLTGEQILQKKISDAKEFVKKIDWVQFNEVMKNN